MLTYEEYLKSIAEHEKEIEILKRKAETAKRDEEARANAPLNEARATLISAYRNYLKELCAKVDLTRDEEDEEADIRNYEESIKKLESHIFSLSSWFSKKKTITSDEERINNFIDKLLN